MRLLLISRNKLYKEIFNFEENRLKEEVVNRRASRVLIQLPEGFKTEGPRLAEIVEKAGAEAIVSAEPCYGACDLPLCEAQTLKRDLIVHYGHSPFPIDNLFLPCPIIYIEAKAKIDFSNVIEDATRLLEPYSRIGLATTVQHVDCIQDIARAISRSRKTVITGSVNHLEYPAQILGCDYSNAKAISSRVEAFLYFGGGQFHPIGLYLSTMKPTVVADPFERIVYSVEPEAKKIVRKRWIDIAEAKEKTRFGVIIGLKSGQTRLKEATDIKQKLEMAGRKATLLALREITPIVLLQFPKIEAYVNTACPRIALEESGFQKPVLTKKELDVAIGNKKWEELLKEGFI